MWLKRLQKHSGGRAGGGSLSARITHSQREREREIHAHESEEENISVASKGEKRSNEKSERPPREQEWPSVLKFVGGSHKGGQTPSSVAGGAAAAESPSHGACGQFYPRTNGPVCLQCLLNVRWAGAQSLVAKRMRGQKIGPTIETRVHARLPFPLFFCCAPQQLQSVHALDASIFLGLLLPRPTSTSVPKSATLHRCLWPPSSRAAATATELRAALGGTNSRVHDATTPAAHQGYANHCRGNFSLPISTHTHWTPSNSLCCLPHPTPRYLHHAHPHM